MLVRAFSVLFLLSCSTYANETYSHSIYFGAGPKVSVYEPSENLSDTESLGYEAVLGYSFNDYVSLEAGYTNYGIQLFDINPWLSRLKLSIPVSDYASLYFGAGGNMGEYDFSPSLSAGVKYNISSKWALDIGYQYMMDADSNNADVTSLSMLLEYNFSNKSAKNTKVDAIVNNQESTNDILKTISEPTIEESSNEVPTQELVISKEKNEAEKIVKRCGVQIIEYVVGPGDWLRKIAREHNMGYELFLNYNALMVKRKNKDLIFPGEKVYVLPGCG